MIQEKKLVFWDWNGTLLNDTMVSIEAMNHMLVPRGMDLLTEERYKEIFRFPVQEYYQDLGFDFSRESFDVLSIEFVTHYRRLQAKAPLHPGALPILEAFRLNGVRQVLLSAMEKNTLRHDVIQRGIHDFFETMLGLDDIYARGKVDVARDFLLQESLDPGQILVLGDTRHDFEVASSLGCTCILVAQGHQPFDRLVNTGAKVQKSLEDVLNFLINP
jgi:phosphoglycolate phosphatase